VLEGHTILLGGDAVQSGQIPRIHFLAGNANVERRALKPVELHLGLFV
jgi:hypothetical protein